MKTKKIIALIISVIILITLFTACSSDSITLNEPKYKGEAANSKPQFQLSWSKVADTDNYQLAIYAEGEGFAVRSTKDVFGATEATITLLQGVYTDTVRYRIKVGPYISSSSEPEFWSNIYEINFIDGEYTIQATTEDFDDIISDETSETTIVSDSPTNTSNSGTEPTHNLPEKFMDFIKTEENSEISLDNISYLTVNVNHDMYAEPTQTITSEDTIKKVKSALEYMTVTEKVDDNTGSLNTYYGYTFYDASGNYLFSFIIQDGMLITNFGRYNVDGLSMLTDNSGIMLENEWTQYWYDYEIKEDEYTNNYEMILPAPLLPAAGYATNDIANIDPSQVTSVTCYVDWNEDAGKLYTTDPSQISAIVNGMKNVSITAVETEPKGQMWHMTFTYNVEGQTFPSSAYLSFIGNCVEIGDNYYETSGLDEVFAGVDADIFSYLTDYRIENKVEPVY